MLNKNRIFPTWENINTLKTPLTDGEYTLAKFLLSLGFKDNYRSVIIEGSPRIMILIMNFLIGT